ncbi:hypothetical protein CI102_12713 [Trichoderma harzianum]|nr:hypothetical protein CI102_12713 [Trichoderma harzianum]
MYLWEPLGALSASAIRQRLRVVAPFRRSRVSRMAWPLTLSIQAQRGERHVVNRNPASTTSLSACAQPFAGVWIGQVGRTCKHQSKPSPAFGLTGLTVAVTNNAWRRDSVRGRPVDGRGEKREASQSTCSLAQQLRLSDGARFRGCVSCMDTTLIPLGNGTDQIHVRSALHGEDDMDISSHGRLESVKRFHLPLCYLDALLIFV